MNEVKVTNQTGTGFYFWAAGWMFTIGYIPTVDISGLPWWEQIGTIIVSMLIWPLILGIQVGGNWK